MLCAYQYSPLSEMLIGQLTHAWASTANDNKAAVLNKLLRAKLDAAEVLQMVT